jgi:hypothetical protein
MVNLCYRTKPQQRFLHSSSYSALLSELQRFTHLTNLRETLKWNLLMPKSTYKCSSTTSKNGDNLHLRLLGIYVRKPQIVNRPDNPLEFATYVIFPLDVSTFLFQLLKSWTNCFCYSIYWTCGTLSGLCHLQPRAWFSTSTLPRSSSFKGE